MPVSGFTLGSLQLGVVLVLRREGKAGRGEVDGGEFGEVRGLTYRAVRQDTWYVQSEAMDASPWLRLKAFQVSSS